jgi:hypothetical protein
MITLFRKTFRNPRCEFLFYLPAILLGCAFVLIPRSTSAQNAPAGPIAPGASPDQGPATQTQTPAASSGAHPNLAGTWQLNKKQSDDPREKMREARDEQGGGGAEAGGGRGGRGMGAGHRGQGQGNDMTKEYAKLTITQTDSMAKVTNDSGRVLALYSSADQSQNESSTGDSNKSDNSKPQDSAAAQWQQDQLVATTQTRGGSATRTYELSPDGKQLYLTTRVENQRLSQPVVIRFVYDSIKSSQ